MLKGRAAGRNLAGVVAAIAIAGSAALHAQQSAPATGLTLAQAVDAALRNYPSVKVSQEEIDAAAAGVQLARTAYLPRVDLLAQADRATRNNVFGLLLSRPFPVRSLAQTIWRPCGAAPPAL